MNLTKAIGMLIPILLSACSSGDIIEDNMSTETRSSCYVSLQEAVEKANEHYNMTLLTDLKNHKL